MITNVHNIPDVFVRAIEANQRRYKESRVNSDYSKSDLVRPVQARILGKRHWREIKEDVSKRLDALMGTAMHKLLEDAVGTNELAEKRFFVNFTVNGKPLIVSAQMDNLHLQSGLLRDFKTAKVWAYKLPDKIDWEWDLNIQAFIIRANGLLVDRIVIDGYLKDWSHRRVETEEGYPPIPFFEKEFRLWSMEEAREWIQAQLQRHEDAINLADDKLPECSLEERWGKPEVWAVKKKGGKRALPGGLHPTLAKAEAMIEGRTGLEIEHRPEENVRCDSFCSVAPFCVQNRKWIIEAT